MSLLPSAVLFDMYHFMSLCICKCPRKTVLLIVIYLFWGGIFHKVCKVYNCFIRWRKILPFFFNKHLHCNKAHALFLSFVVFSLSSAYLILNFHFTIATKLRWNSQSTQSWVGVTTLWQLMHGQTVIPYGFCGSKRPLIQDNLSFKCKELNLSLWNQCWVHFTVAISFSKSHFLRSENENHSLYLWCSVCLSIFSKGKRNKADTSTFYFLWMLMYK